MLLVDSSKPMASPGDRQASDYQSFRGLGSYRATLESFMAPCFVRSGVDIPDAVWLNMFVNKLTVWLYREEQFCKQSGSSIANLEPLRSVLLEKVSKK